MYEYLSERRYPKTKIKREFDISGLDMRIQPYVAELIYKVNLLLSASGVTAVSRPIIPKERKEYICNEIALAYEGIKEFAIREGDPSLSESVIEIMINVTLFVKEI